MSHSSFKRDKIDEILTSVNVISDVPALVTPRLQSPVTDIQNSTWAFNASPSVVASELIWRLCSLPSPTGILCKQLIISFRNFHCILLLHITHSSKVNCTLDKVNCTLYVRKHTILGPAASDTNRPTLLTSSSVVAKRPRDASCLSVVKLQIYHCVHSDAILLSVAYRWDFLS